MNLSIQWLCQCQVCFQTAEKRFCTFFGILFFTSIDIAWGKPPINGLLVLPQMHHLSLALANIYFKSSH